MVPFPPLLERHDIPLEHDGQWTREGRVPVVLVNRRALCTAAKLPWFVYDTNSRNSLTLLMFAFVGETIAAFAKIVRSVGQLPSKKLAMRIQETSALPRMARRRSEADRRTLPDRRLSPSRTRLRVGLWYQYHRITRGGEFDPFPRDQYKRSRLEEALLPEILKYEFCERVEGGPVSSPRALSEAVEHLWSNPAVGCNAAGESVAVYAINEIADYLDRRYEITALDRRKADRRAAQA